MDYIYQTVCGIDVHQHMLMCTIVRVEGGKTHFSTKEFKNLSKDFLILHDWLKSQRVEKVIFESTGVYWNVLMNYLTEEGYQVDVVNAFHVKKFLVGRQTYQIVNGWQSFAFMGY